jgi:hypothetical protein
MSILQGACEAILSSSHTCNGFLSILVTGIFEHDAWANISRGLPSADDGYSHRTPA